MVRIGISGWTYAPWRGTFFPHDLAQREELAYASRRFASIEINGTFYALQKPESYAKWHAATPAGFVFAVKAPRFITHIKRLKGGPRLLANFFASGVLQLEEKLGPILWQLPPNFRFDHDVLEAFLAALPRTTEAAAKLAEQHDSAVKSAWTESKRRRRLRHALEVRHPSFASAEFIALLRKHRVALVVADTAGKWPLLEDVTADFVYVRLHGDSELYVSGYTPSALSSWGARVAAWAKGRTPSSPRLAGSRKGTGRRSGRDVYVYFDNDVKVRAPFDAMNLAHRLALGPKPPPAPASESVVEQPRTRWPGFGGSRVRMRRVPKDPVAAPARRRKTKASR